MTSTCYIPLSDIAFIVRVILLLKYLKSALNTSGAFHDSLNQKPMSALYLFNVHFSSIQKQVMTIIPSTCYAYLISDNSLFKGMIVHDRGRLMHLELENFLNWLLDKSPRKLVNEILQKHTRSLILLNM